MPLPPRFASVVSKVTSIIPQKGDPKPPVYIVAEVGTSRILAAIVRVGAEAVDVLGFATVPQEDETMVGGMIGQLDNLVEKLDEAVTKASDRAGQ